MRDVKKDMEDKDQLNARVTKCRRDETGLALMLPRCAVKTLRCA